MHEHKRERERERERERDETIFFQSFDPSIDNSDEYLRAHVLEIQEHVFMYLLANTYSDTYIFIRKYLHTLEI